ncbi:MAG: hypothetical protein ABIQ53_01220 [Terracoccus sp.]
MQDFPRLAALTQPGRLTSIVEQVTLIRDDAEREIPQPANAFLVSEAATALADKLGNRSG